MILYSVYEKKRKKYIFIIILIIPLSRVDEVEIEATDSFNANITRLYSFIP